MVEKETAQARVRTMWGESREQIVEESWDVRLPRLSHAGSPATANMTSRAGASVSPPATSLCLSLPRATAPFILLLLSSSSSSQASFLLYSPPSGPVETAVNKVKDDYAQEYFMSIQSAVVFKVDVLYPRNSYFLVTGCIRALSSSTKE